MQTVLCVTIVVLGFLAYFIYSSQGWSSVTVTEVKDSTQATEGVPFYEPRPYLLVTKTEAKDASGTVTTTFVNQIIWLPNPARRFKVQIKSGWGTVDGSVKLQNGWMLETLGVKTDSKVPETLAAIGGLVSAAIPKAVGGTPSVAGLTEGLYLIEIAATGEVTLKKAT